MQRAFEYPFPLLIIAGKGGVGKTVLTAAIGTETARAGHSTLLIELGGQRQLLPLLLDRKTSEEDLPESDDDGIVPMGKNLSWSGISPDRLLAGWLSGRNMGLIADRLERSGALSVIATSVPGIKDVLLVGFLRRLVESQRFDRIIVDGPASGRARELLRAPMMVARAAAEGPIYDQAARGHELLTNAETAALLLVTLPEETPVNETIETAFDAEDQPGIHLAGVVVNRVFPDVAPLDTAADGSTGTALSRRYQSVTEQTKRLADELPVPQWLIGENPRGVETPAQVAELIDGEFPLTERIEEGRADETEQDATAFDVLDVALHAPIVVTVGTGGVGKTTLGATLAWREAARGKSVALITIDPAKRLADALGLASLDDELREVAVPGSGRLVATMLDPGQTFKRVVRSEATTDAHAERILSSPLASQLTDSLSGMTEYMAVERLWQLHTDPDIDVVVVDTPPSSDALAFLDAPTLLARLLDNRMYQVLVHGSRRSLLDRALGGVVKQLVSTVGGAVVRDAVAFFKSLEGVEDGLRARSDQIHKILRSEATSVIVVTTPTGLSLTNAQEFVTQLRSAGVEPALTIANRCTPSVQPRDGDTSSDLVGQHLRIKRRSEIASLDRHDEISTLPVVRVDDLPTPVVSIEGIEALAGRLDPPR